MAKGIRGESPSQTLTRHIVGLFTLVLIWMHIALGVYYFEGEGSYFRHLTGFLTYIKTNVENTHVSRIQVIFQDKIQRIKGTSTHLYRWAGNNAGYYCDGVYQNDLCATTSATQFKFDPTYTRNFYFLSGTLATAPKSVSFVIERCPSAGCTPLSPTAPATPTTFKIVQDQTSQKYYVQINNSIELQDYKLNSLYLGVQEPCINQDGNSILPSYLQFPQYKQNGTCDRFGVIPNTIPITQDITDPNTGTISLNIKETFQENEMSIMLTDLGKSFGDLSNTVTPQDFKLYLIPKISYNSQISDSSTCTVDDDLSRVPSYSNYINQTGLGFFIVRQIFIVFLIPIPIVEFLMGLQKNPQVVLVGIGSKILIIINLLLFILEGSLIRHEYLKKTNLVNKIRNLGWKVCFDDVINQKFMKFPSVFSSTQDTFNYYDDVFMWIASVGLFILILLFIKLGMDMCVKKKKYGEYDADENEQNVGYDPTTTVAYVPYQDQFMESQVLQQQQLSQLQQQQQQQQYLTYSQQLLAQPPPAQPISFVKTPTNRQKLMQSEKKNNLSTIKESLNKESMQQSAKQKKYQKSQSQEMQILQSSSQQNNKSDSDEDY